VLGRRPLYVVGSLAMAIMMTVLGLVFVLEIEGWPVVVIISLAAAPHAIALGALSWLVVSEIFPTRIRAKAMGVCSVSLWTACFVIVYLAPILFDLSEDLFNVPSGVFFLCAFVSLVSFFFLLKILPETKGRTLEEIAESWTRKK